MENRFLVHDYLFGKTASPSVTEVSNARPLAHYFAIGLTVSVKATTAIRKFG
jgi:hypothetical protein